MKKWYEVQTRYYDDGRIGATLMGVIYEDSKPEQRSASLKRCDVYYDYFGSLKEAREFIEECKYA